MVATRSHVNRRAQSFEPALLKSSLDSAVKSLEMTRRTGKIGRSHPLGNGHV
jgi:hypothetical protein